ncbi:Putative RNA (fragment) [Acinetobacter sp. 8I-beige]
MPISKTGALPLGDTPKFDYCKMAGVAGFEPTDADIKNRCLTTWRYP